MRGPLIALLLLAAVPSAVQAEDDPATETEHKVKAGETLSGIANRAVVPRVLIIEANGLKAPYRVREGQVLVIPRRRSHTVKDGETGFGIAIDYGVAWSAIAQASGLDPKKPLRAGTKLVIPTAAAAPAAALVTAPAAAASTTDYAWPVTGKIRRSFVARGGKAAFHDGIDILSPAGTAVRASAAGRVIYADEGPAEYGRTVIVQHDGRWTTTYSFLDRITVKDGDRVRAGERVGLVGQTGLAKEPQLHFEIRQNRVAIDPLSRLPERP